MLTWQTIEDLPDRTPVPLDLALEALQPDNPRALLLRLYSGGHLLEEQEPTPIMKAARDHLAAIGGATGHLERSLAPAETLTPYLSGGPASWTRLYILREELLALRPAPKLETSPAGQARKIVLPVPGTKETAARPPEKMTLTGSAAEALAEMEKRTMAEAIAEMERDLFRPAAEVIAETFADAMEREKNIIRPIFRPLNENLGLFPPPAPPPAPPAAAPTAPPDHQGGRPVLIGSTYYTGRKEIMAALGVSSWNTVKGYMERGLIVTHNPAGKPQTTKEEIDRWRSSPTGTSKAKK